MYSHQRISKRKKHLHQNHETYIYMYHMRLFFILIRHLVHHLFCNMQLIQKDVKALELERGRSTWKIGQKRSKMEMF